MNTIKDIKRLDKCDRIVIKDKKNKPLLELTKDLQILPRTNVKSNNLNSINTIIKNNIFKYSLNILDTKLLKRSRNIIINSKINNFLYPFFINHLLNNLVKVY